MTRVTLPPGAVGTTSMPVSRLAIYETTATPVRSARALGVKHHRCAWAVVVGSPEYLRYHDTEWGVPVYDDAQLFELLVLACAQAGLSWWTVISRREHYRRAFANFDPHAIAGFDKRRQRDMLEVDGVIRNSHKIAATVTNARQFLDVQAQFGSFAQYLWGFIDGVPVQNRYRSALDVPSQTLLSERVSHDLKQRGFRYVGPKSIYAYMQAAGLVNDHLVGCFRHGSVIQLTRQQPFKHTDH